MLVVCSIGAAYVVVMFTAPGSGSSPAYKAFLAVVQRGLYLLVGGYALTFTLFAIAGKAYQGMAVGLFVGVAAAGGWYSWHLQSANERTETRAALFAADLKGPLADMCGAAKLELTGKPFEPVRSAFYNLTSMDNYRIGPDFRYLGLNLDSRPTPALELDFREVRDEVSSDVPGKPTYRLVRRARGDQGETVIDAPTADVELSSREEMKEVTVDDRRYRVRSVTKTVMDRRSSEQLGRWTYVHITIGGAAGSMCSPTGPDSILYEAEMFARVIGQLPR